MMFFEYYLAYILQNNDVFLSYQVMCIIFNFVLIVFCKFFLFKLLKTTYLLKRLTLANTIYYMLLLFIGSEGDDLFYD